MASSSSSSSPKCPSPSTAIKVVSPSSSSTINVANFVSIKLFKDNYPLWKTQMKCLVVSQDLVGFIDGSISQPAEPEPSHLTNNQDYLIWRKTDHLLKGWILGTLSEEVLSTVIDLETARDVWAYLEKNLGRREHTSVDPKQPSLTASHEGDLTKYLPLYQAVLKEHWIDAHEIIDRDKDALRAKITKSSETVLHLAVGMGPKGVKFVEKLVKMMPKEVLSSKNREGDTALSLAAITDNIEAAKLLVKKSPESLNIRDNEGRLPIHLAARYGNRDTLGLLLRHHKREDGLIGPNCDVMFVVDVIDAGFIDIALALVSNIPSFALFQVNGDSPMAAIARKASIWKSGTSLNFWQSLIYFCVAEKLDNYHITDITGIDKIRIPIRRFKKNCFTSVCQGLRLLLSEAAGLFLPQVNRIRHKKRVHCQAFAFVRLMCEKIMEPDVPKSDRHHILKDALFLAASLGIQEVVEEIVVKYPDAIWFKDENNCTIFQLAVIQRHEDVFKLIYHISGQQRYITSLRDIWANNILHLAAKLAPRHKLELIPGPLLQMQHDLQWFKAVQRFVHSAQKKELNFYGQTPSMVFSNEHKELVVEGENWLKGMANSTTSILISAVIFAATFSIPGGYTPDDDRLSNSSKRFAFVLFVISESISLFASTTSLLVFLSILSTRFAERDFFLDLPTRLILGLSSLFLSITSMMITFCATLYLVFGQNETWVIGPMIALACLPITSFVSLQFPILASLVSSTYGHGIWVHYGDCPF